MRMSETPPVKVNAAFLVHISSPPPCLDSFHVAYEMLDRIGGLPFVDEIQQDRIRNQSRELLGCERIEFLTCEAT